MPLSNEERNRVRTGTDFEELYAGQAATTFRTVYLLCRDRTIAEDATQEAFARALERWDRLRDESWVGGWVTTTAMNVARRSSPRLFHAPRQPTSETAETEERLDLWRAVQRLPRRQQQAVILHYLEDLSVEQVAGAMGCGAGTAKTHLFRALQALRRMLGVDDE
jgi:RNA polymerase sigma-70 factor, ECF subfamily